MLMFGELPSLLGESLNSSQTWLVTSSSIGTPSDPTTNMVTVSNKQSLGPLKGKKSPIGILMAEWISNNTTTTLFILSAATENMQCDLSLYKRTCVLVYPLIALVKIHV